MVTDVNVIMKTYQILQFAQGLIIFIASLQG